LGSLTQAAHRETAACGNCGSERVTQLSMSLTDGTPVRFVSCHVCEERSWMSATGPITVDAVLDRARKQ
jgi:formate dehydrogenase maturation protein FdhE